MTNYCLRTGPLPRPVADAAMSILEAAENFLPLSLSLSDCGDSSWEIEAQYSGKVTAESAAAALRALQIAERAVSVSPLPNIDWVRKSLEGLQPVTAGRFFLHGSHHRALCPNHAASIEIDAGTAFGTGHHATTRGCLLALDHLLKRAHFRRALDIGCGTGILAIAFARVTHECVLAIDIDPEAVRVTAANARLNGVAERVRAMVVAAADRAVIAAPSPYDMIFANILARPLVALAPCIARLAAKGGATVLSGLQSNQERSVEASYRLLGFHPSLRIRLEGWSTLVLSRT